MCFFSTDSEMKAQEQEEKEVSSDQLLTDHSPPPPPEMVVRTGDKKKRKHQHCHLKRMKTDLDGLNKFACKGVVQNPQNKYTMVRTLC